MKARHQLSIAVVLTMTLLGCTRSAATGPITDVSSTSAEAADLTPPTTVPRSMLPADASNIATLIADVDGDGVPEEVLTDEEANGHHHLITLTSMGRTVVTDIDAPKLAIVPIIAADDLGSGADAVLLETAESGTAFTLVPYLLTEDGWAPIDAPDSATGLYAITVSTTIGEVYGVSCHRLDGSPGLTIATITGSNDDGFRLSTTQYHLEGTSLVQTGSPAVHRTIIPRADLSIEDFATIDCDAVH